jgi:tRNA pseudouridine38-40 synthase
MRYFLSIAYQGTHYHGWQEQLNAITVQGVIQDKLTQLLGQQVKIVGSGRTDTGVHAAQQWAHVDLAEEVHIDQLRHQLNRILPNDIAINAIHPVIPTAHARFDALNRTYTYTLSPRKDPFCSHITHTFTKELQLDKMNEAAESLKAFQNFAAFSKVGSPTAYPYLCTIYEASWRENTNQQLVFRITANRFLRGMVRAIVGNLLKVGLGQKSVADFQTIIQSQDRSLSAGLVPPTGLVLQQVVYPQNILGVASCSANDFK